MFCSSILKPSAEETFTNYGQETAVLCTIELFLDLKTYFFVLVITGGVILVKSKKRNWYEKNREEKYSQRIFLLFQLLKRFK